MNTFNPGDKVTPRGSIAWSIGYVMTVWEGEVVTVQSEQSGVLILRERNLQFLSHDFRLASHAGNHTESPQAHAVAELRKNGDKVTPKRGAVRSTDGNVTITQNQVVTIKDIKTDWFTVTEVFGVYCTRDFKLASSFASPATAAEPVKKYTWSSPAPTPQARPTPQQVQLPASRKGLKKHFERELNTTLEWRGGYLCYAGTNNRIWNSPHMEKEKKPAEEKEHWSARY